MKADSRHSESGFALAALIFFLTAMSILIVVTVPSYQMQAKRMQEEELIFRGEEYMRAIQKFQRKFGVYPPSIDALSQTNGLRFLRKPYADPITGKPFRLIYINPDGSVTGSKMLNPMSNNLSSNLGQGLQQPQSQQALGMAQMQQGLNSAQNQRQQATASQQQTGTGGTFKVGGGVSAPTKAQGGTIGGNGTIGGTTGGISGTNPSGGTSGSAGIIGVASDSELESVKVYNSRQHYNEWEFIAILQPNQGQQGQQNQQQNQNQNQQQNQQNQQNQRPGSGNSNFGIGSGMPGFGPQIQPGSPTRPGNTQPGLPGPSMFGTSGPSQPNQPIKRPPG